MITTVNIGNDWDEILKDEWEKPYYLELRQFLKNEYSTKTIYPPMQDIFNALKYTSFEDTKVVIIGQDPYHGPNQAHGLCFSVKEGVEPPPSLKNMFIALFIPVHVFISVECRAALTKRRTISRQLQIIDTI